MEHVVINCQVYIRVNLCSHLKYMYDHEFILWCWGWGRGIILGGKGTGGNCTGDNYPGGSNPGGGGN